jgi:hypothetical protein
MAKRRRIMGGVLAVHEHDALGGMINRKMVASIDHYGAGVLAG